MTWRTWLQVLRIICACAPSMICASAQAEPQLVVGPYVQDLQINSFVVVFETSESTLVTVQAGPAKVITHGIHHEVRLRDLPPRSHVRYQVSAEGKRLGGGEVTLPDATRPFQFVVFGDTRDGNATVRPLGEAAHQLAPDLILHTGDWAIAGDNVQAWIDVFQLLGPLLADVPLYPALGNHEIWHDPSGETFRRFFVLPDDGRTRHYYTFRFGPARFIVLDGNAPEGTQTEWLAATLQAAASEGVPHVFVLVHQPPFSLGDHCGNALSMPDWVELFEHYRVRAVFAGHDHAYQRMERRGVRYFVSGGGGAPLYIEHSCSKFDRKAKRVYRAEHHLLHVRVTGPNVEVTALPVDGDAPPLDVVRFSSHELPFAMEADALRASDFRPHPWAVGSGVAFLLVAGLAVRRRRRLR